MSCVCGLGRLILPQYGANEEARETQALGRMHPMRMKGEDAKCCTWCQGPPALSLLPLLEIQTPRIWRNLKILWTWGKCFHLSDP